MPTPAASTGPLSPEQQRQLIEANAVAKKIVAGPVHLSGINAAILACGFGLSAVWAVICFIADAERHISGQARTGLASDLFIDFTNLVIAAALGYLTWNERRGRAVLSQYDPRGAVILRENQYYVMGFVVVYCVWAMLSVNPKDYAELGGALGVDMSKDIVRATYATYGGIALITTAVQFFMAGIYSRAFTRLSEYVAQTPEWLISIQRSFSN